VSSLQSRYIDWDESHAWVVAPGETSRHSHHYEVACTLTMSEIVLQSTEKVLIRSAWTAAEDGSAWTVAGTRSKGTRTTISCEIVCGANWFQENNDTE
jgi:hypothetical protein